MGEPNEVNPRKGVFHENPFSCICEEAELDGSTLESRERYSDEYEQDLSESEYADDDVNGKLLHSVYYSN